MMVTPNYREMVRDACNASSNDWVVRWRECQHAKCIDFYAERAVHGITWNDPESKNLIIYWTICFE